MIGVRIAAAALALACGTLARADAAAQAAAHAAGSKLYLEGKRAGGLAISGAEAACASCHRRSALGGAEGRSYIPPIDAAFLFAARPPGTGAGGVGRPAYTDAALARAIRDGVDPGGRRLDYLMPRYALEDAEMKSLIAYLRGLPARTSPGVGAGVVHFATVIAPGAGAASRRAMIEVIESCFAERNSGLAPERGRKRLGPDMRFGEQRKWKLHVWELQGKAQSWAAQLAEYARRKPVFAVVGGLGGGNWGPVHDFCERDGIPCLFPRVEVPVTRETAFYALYLSRGVLLEAAILARHFAEDAQGARRGCRRGWSRAGSPRATKRCRPMPISLARRSARR